METLYSRYVKRILDFIFSLLLILVLSPLFAVVAILVRMELGSPVIYRQDRPGKQEKIFSLCKFRSMSDGRDENGSLLPDAERMTKFGLWLRRTSFDELPELVNIIKGDMSFIGPRPLLIQYLDRYNEFQKQRHEVRPGLTGLAQINGRNDIGWKERFEYDVDYVQNVRFSLDVKIFFATIGTVLKREGISEQGEATMSEFLGEE